ncbi:MAG: L,D-transpeptidase family protein [Chitinophagaceae bacterium]
MMLQSVRYSPLSVIILVGVFLASCKSSSEPPENDIVKDKEKLSVHVTTNIDKFLTYASDNKSQLNDSLSLHGLDLVKKVYEIEKNGSIWSEDDAWKPIADSLFSDIEDSRSSGLFPMDYHYHELAVIRKEFAADSLQRRDAALWAKADLLLTDAFFEMARHLKLGRIPRDSTTLRNDSLYDEAYFLKTFSAARATGAVLQTLHGLEPAWPEYLMVKAGIRSFLDSANFKRFTYLDFPAKDSSKFSELLARRLAEEGMYNGPTLPDTASLGAAIRSYQAAKDIKVTGKISDGMVRVLNNTDQEKFKRIAITLDRYKLMPESQPQSYVFVNLAAYLLYVYDDDTISLTSKVIIGAPKKNTPLLNASISNFITYPQWTVPYSIIFKEMLPKIRKNVSYLEHQNLMIVDRNDSVVDPNLVDWSKMNEKHFPYLIRQRQGDDNSLGVMKFNFANKYSVYLHDTNARGLFSRSSRALSHGCVRVQKWESLSRFLVRSDTIRFPTDTLAAWIGRREKHTVSGFPRVPLFIRYFTVEGKNDRLIFYSDIYGYDRIDRNKFFSKRKV